MTLNPMLTRIFHKPAFKKSWMIASIIVGASGILGGVYQITHQYAGGLAGIVGGAIVVVIGSFGLWALHEDR